MGTKNTPRSNATKDKQALAAMLKHQPVPLPKPPQLAQRTRTALEDAEGPRRRVAPRTEMQSRTEVQSRPLPQFVELFDDEPRQRTARISPMAQARLDMDQAHLLRAPRTSVAGGASGAALRGLLGERPWIVALVAALSIAIILVLFSAPPRIVFTGMPLPGGALAGDAAAALAPLPQAPNGEHSILGAPTISAEQIDAVLNKYGSPAAGTGSIWIELGQQHNINPAYALAFFIHESTAGTAAGWAGWKGDGSSTHNVGNIICAGYATCFNRFRDYPGWREGIADWYRLIDQEYVQGRGVYTVEQIIPIYAPSFENDVPAYVQTVANLVQGWRR